jgi:hypothetical protein
MEDTMHKPHVLLTLSAGEDDLTAQAVTLFAVRWKERTRIPLKRSQPGPAKPAWSIRVGTVKDASLCSAIAEAGLPAPVQPQSYALAVQGRTLTLCGADGHGVLYGLGHVLRQLELEPARAPMPMVRETRTPAVYNRGVYFATHFNNYYESAPLARLDRYIEEMALWGLDLLMFWFDSNWFPFGFWKDPESRGSRMAARIRHIGEKARSCGMKVGTAGIANEGFANQPPPELRADIRARHGGFYPYSQICPSKPEGLHMILENRRKIVEQVGPLDFYIHWPYDQGGCGCDRCAHEPGRWGRKFLELGPAIAAIVKEANPAATIFVSTWFMDGKERDMVYALCDRKADWFQGLITQSEHAAERPVDPRYTRLVFPEISMFGCYFTSYGCNGANPAPARFETQAREIARAGCGTLLYSEGLYEDLNKAVYAGLLWDPERTAGAIVDEYARYYFGRRNVKQAGALIRGLETTWGAKALLRAEPGTVGRLAVEARKLLTRLPKFRDALERGRLLSDRAEMDLLMKKAGPDTPLTAESRALFEGAPYLPDAELRKRISLFLARLRERKALTDRLFTVHWRYMTFFHMEKIVLVFLPDSMMGKYNWESLIGPLSKAARSGDETRMRAAVSRAFKRWYWFNGIDFNYLFF